MELTATEELALPPSMAWASVTNFAGFETLIREKGGEVTRSQAPDPPGCGTRWTGCFSFQGKPREIAAEVVRFDAPDSPAAPGALGIDLASAGLDGALTVDLADAGAGRTRVEVRLTIQARSLKARLAMQPLKLAHGTMQARFAARVSKLARALEKRRRKL